MFHCTPHQGLGKVLAGQLQVDLATCLTARAPAVPASLAAVRVTKDSQSIMFKGKVVLTIHENHNAGGDRISTHNKWLIATGPPDWRAHVLVRDPHVAFGSLACDGGGVVVQSAPASGVNDIVHAHWSIWSIRFDGPRTRLTTPPRGVSDQSPQVAGSVVYFVRKGWLYALRAGRLLKLPPATIDYYGHTAWPYTVTR